MATTDTNNNRSLLQSRWLVVVYWTAIFLVCVALIFEPLKALATQLHTSYIAWGSVQLISQQPEGQ